MHIYVYIYICVCVHLKEANSARARSRSRIVDCSPAFLSAFLVRCSARDICEQKKQAEVDALGVITVSRERFERCCSNKKSPPYYSNFSFVTLQTNGRLCSVRPHTVRRPRLALGDGAATRVGFFGV